MISEIVAAMAVMFAAVLAHESGHVFYHRLHKKNLRTKFYFHSWRDWGYQVGEDKDYYWMTAEEYSEEKCFGLLAGLIIIGAAAYFTALWLVALLIPYAWGAREDIKAVRWK